MGRWRLLGNGAGLLASRPRPVPSRNGHWIGPRSDKDANYGAFKEFARQSFLQYMGHYVDAVHQHNPNFRIASNWAYSSMMPEPITTNVDFLSGDLTPSNSVNSAALEGRIMAAQGQLYRKPWDLMSWSFWYEFSPCNGRAIRKRLFI